jgi:hypothetical protein
MLQILGLADRLVGATTVLFIAILTNRAFQIGRRERLPNLETAFTSPNINWHRELDPDWLIEPLKDSAQIKNYNETIISSKKYYAVNTIGDIRLQDRLLRQDLSLIMGTDAETTLMVINRGKTIRMFENEHYTEQTWNKMKLNPYIAFGCLLNYFLQPKSEIFLPVYDQFMAMSSLDPTVLKISIQIRTGDHTWNGGNVKGSAADGRGWLESLERYFTCAQQIEDFVMKSNPGKYNSVIWYLTTESKSLRYAAVEKYGSKLVTSVESTLEHSAKESSVCQGDAAACTVKDVGFATAAAEWWMIGYAQYHVVTLNSGFGRSGGFRTYTNDTMYTLDNKAIQCNAGGFSDLEHIMYDWSGI